jgi:membrane protease YdiL (CAAX protease family)
MTQPSDGIRRDADLHGVTPTLPAPPESPLQPDEFVRAVRFVFLAVVLFLLQPLWTSAAVQVLRGSGFYVWYYGPEIVAAAFAAKSATQQVLQVRLQWWANALAFPFALGSAALLLWRLPAAYRVDIGVSLGRFFPHGDNRFMIRRTIPAALGLHLLFAVASWLVLAPLTLGVNRLVVTLLAHFVEVKPEEHPFTQAAQAVGLHPAEWGLLAFSVLVTAPFWEELFFRGALVALCRKVRNGGHAALLLALVAALLERQQQINEAAGSGFDALLVAVSPALFVLALTPLYVIVWWFSRTGEGPIVFGTALLFAAVHSFAWPTPVALFILGLGLGWLAVWTRSLLAPMVVHSLFNAVSFVLLFVN